MEEIRRTCVLCFARGGRGAFRGRRGRELSAERIGRARDSSAVSAPARRTRTEQPVVVAVFSDPMPHIFRIVFIICYKQRTRSITRPGGRRGEIRLTSLLLSGPVNR